MFILVAFGSVSVIVVIATAVAAVVAVVWH